jgi:hypothetical protein
MDGWALVLLAGGPRAQQGANWKHGHFSREAKADGRACGRQYLRSAIYATRSKGSRGPAAGSHRTIYLTGIDANGKVASACRRLRPLS